MVRPNAHPFNYQGQPVVPYRDQHRGWGFWLFGNWIPLAFGS
ncbi:hypothetical protein [Gordonia jinhuaensis]|nr:hypothetical protein [Gordonia jinhuaensis]